MNAIDKAVKRAREAWEDWGFSPIATRIEVLNRFKGILTEYLEEFTLTIAQETGKPLWEARTEVQAMIQKIPLAIQAFHERTHPTSRKVPQGDAYTRYKPFGVIVVLGPFNFPGHLPNGHIAPAILAGNAVLFKPSEYTPRVGEMTLRCWHEAGLPEGILQVIQGGKEVGSALVQHRGIDGLFFTGSWPTGKQLAERFAADTGKILALEMGGNNPLVVTSVKDPIAAALVTIQSAFLTAGQRCSCARRLIVLKGPEGDRFLKTLIETTQKIRVGLYTDIPEAFMGPVISLNAAHHILEAAQFLRQRGGKDLLKMEQPKANIPLLTPGIMDVTACSERPDEEIFGPFLQVIRVKNLEQGIKEANNTRYGLTAGLLSTSAEEYDHFFKKVRAGVINWNLPLTGASSQGPFGGVGCSGNNRPSAYFAADYCSYPVASLENPLILPPSPIIGISL